MVTPWINMGERPNWLNIPRVEAAYGKLGVCRFVGMLCLKQGKGFTDSPVAVFWQEKPALSEYSNYFGITTRHSEALIMSAASVAEGFWEGRMSKTGEVLFSRFRHDYRQSRDATVVVDGGRDYFRGRGGTPVLLRVVEDRMEITPPGQTPE